MVGRTVVIFLKSPLFSFTSRGAGALSRDIVMMRGEVVKEKGPGLWIRVTELGTEGDPIEELRYRDDLLLGEVFIPFAKIDYFMFE